MNATRAEKLDHMFHEMVNHLVVAQMWRKATNLLVRTDYVTLKIEALGSRETLEDLYVVYTRLKENGLLEYAREITSFLLSYLLRSGTAHDERLGIEDVDALLNYRPDRTLYLQLLELGSDERAVCASTVQRADVARISMSFRARLAGFRRRMADLDGAESLLEQVLPQLEGYAETRDTTSLKELARYEYDLGYIKFLRGSFTDAAVELSKSAEHARQAGDLVGQTISRCVEYRVRYLGNVVSSEEFERMLKKALTRFEVEASLRGDRSPHALRWVGNAHLHLFEVYYDRADAANAEVHLTAFQTLLDENKGMAGPYSLRADQGRLWILRNGWTIAIEHFKAHFELMEEGKRKGELRNLESLTRDIYDYGRALVGGGNLPEAAKVWEEGMLYPAEPGNHVWKRKIERELQNMSFPGNPAKLD